MAGALCLSAANQGAAVAWIVPTYKHARPVWRFCERLVGHLDGVVQINRTERLIEFPSGGWLGVYSADNDVAVRGEAFDLVVVDEAARISPDTYGDVILPTLADRDGRCLLISTPKGLNWFHSEFVAAQGDGVDRAAWQAPSRDNPMPTIRRAAELARDRVAERTYLQEWEARFVAGGQVFRKVREAARLRPLERGLPGRRYVWGLDWGQIDDFTVASILDPVTAEQVHVDRFNKIDYLLQAARIRILAERFPPLLMIAERNNVGAPVIEILERYNLPLWAWTATNASKHDAVVALSLALDRSEVVLLDDPVQTGELLAYEAEKLPGGLLRYGAPEGMHDDTVVALMLAWLGACSADAGRLQARDFRVVA